MANQKQERQYGLWDSPVTAVRLARGISFSDLAWDSSGKLVWREQRSDRGVLVVSLQDGQAPRELNSQFSVRAQVGYGGGDFTAGHGDVYFLDADSGRIYRQSLEGGLVKAITPALGKAAAPVLSPDGKWMLFVHTYEDQDRLALVDTDGEHWPVQFMEGDDFYMQPCWNPDGSQAAWIAWSHPNMPWDGTYLRLANIRAGEPGGTPYAAETHTIAGDEHTSIFQPQFSPDGKYLAYVSDKTGWWQIYLYDIENRRHHQVTHAPAEHGTPAWVQGLRTYSFSTDGRRIYFIRSQQGFTSLWQVTIDFQAEEPFIEERLPLDEAYTYIEQLAVSPAGDQIALLAQGVTTPNRVLLFSLDGETRVLARGTAEDLPVDYYSPAQPVEWQGLDGGTAYGIFYPPQNPGFVGIGKLPLIVYIHGGPTSQSRATFNTRSHFFTTRGYAVLEVNYRGSTGYGREYRNMLRGNWGIYDVQDAVSGARHMAAKGLVDEQRMVIMGGSAGGFTVLQALIDYPGTFRAAICMYGVTNQFNLVADTHKFEARYSDSLIGPLPDAADRYRERSPINFVDRIHDPIAVFQGEIDQVVPREQSDTLVDSLRRRGVPHEYHLYPGEGHGFRKQETIEAFYNTVERFLRQYVIFA